MSRDDIEQHIKDELDSPTEITEDDVAPEVCTWCGETLGETIVTWDIEVRGMDAVDRYRYCSENCRNSDECAVVTDDEMHPHGQPERIMGEGYE